MTRTTEVMAPVPMRRALRTFGLLASVVVVSACTAYDLPQATDTPAPDPAAGTVAADSPHRQSELETARRELPTASPQEAALRAARASRAPRIGEAEVCGVGIVKTSRGDPAGAQSIPPEARARALVDLRMVSEQAVDPRARAAALTVAARRGDGDEQSQREALDQLARMAHASRDPAIYAMAVDSCRSLTQRDIREGACEPITGWQWAMRDPDNAVPWLSIASWAQVRRDTTLEHTAMTRAAASRRVTWDMASLHDRLMEGLPPDTPWSSRAALSDATTSIGFHLGGMSAPGRYCTAEAVRKSGERRQTCERLANLLLERGTGLHDMGTAWRIGEELGWPPARVQGLRDEVEKLDRVVLAEQRGTYGALSCDALQRRSEWATKVQELGEIAAARQLARGPAPLVRPGLDTQALSGPASDSAPPAR